MAADVKQWLQVLPLPLANALRRAHNDKTALGRHNGAYYFFETCLKLAACAQIGVYLAHDGHDPKLNEELKQLARASAGTWLYLLHTFSRYTSQRSDAALLPLSRIHGRLINPSKLPSARAFIDRDAPQPGAGKLSVQDLFAALVAHRNDEMGHGAQRESAYYERIAPLILDATLEALQLVQPFENLKLALTRVAPDEKTGEARHGFTVLDGTGVHGWEEDEAQLPAGRLWLIGGAVRVPLHPLLIYESGEYDRIGFLNKVVGRPKAGAVVVKRCEYLDYYSGERLQSRDAAAELAALFSRLHKTTVSTDEVERLSLEDGSEAGTRDAVPAQPSTTIGDFEILGELGRGGMGIVYKARQLTLGRIVALKVLPPAMAGDPIAVARFKREIKALGLCDHPNVVKVLTAGQDGDRHFYAMEYVDGCDLSALYDVLSAWGKTSGNLREGHITPAISSAGKLSQARKEISDSGQGLSEEQVREKLAQQIPDMPQLKEGRAAYERLAELMAEAADGLQHLHDRGIIHRDLKPGNLMLTADGKRIVLMDFGLAQLENASLSLTRSADKIMGTLRYMAPEQADMQLRGELVGERSDIYSFGATLYELTTLKPIFEGSSQVQLLEQVQRKEPVAPGKANPSLPKDLETIILKATQKDRDLRYAKAGPSTEAGTVGADLRHFSIGEPISARPPSKFHYLKLFYRRNRTLANTMTAASLLLILATTAFIYTIDQRRQEAEEARLAQQQAEQAAIAERNIAVKAGQDAREAELKALASAAKEREARDEAYSYLGMVHLEKAELARKSGRHQAALAYLAKSREIAPEAVAESLWVDVLINGQGAVWQTPARMGEFRGTFATSPDGRLVAGITGFAFVGLWDVATCIEVRKFTGHVGRVTCVAFSADGQVVLSGSEDRTVRLWNAATGTEIRKFEGQSVVTSVAFSPDGQLVLFGSRDHTLRLWDVANDTEIRTFIGHTESVSSVAFSPDGRIVLSGGWDHTLRLWDAATGTEVRKFTGHVERVTSVVFSRDGRLVLSGSDDRTVRLWDAATGSEIRKFTGHVDRVTSVAFSPDGQFVLSGNWDQTVRLWEAATGTEMRTFVGHTESVTSVAFSPDGRLVLSGSEDKTLRLWDAAAGKEVRSFIGIGHTEGVSSVAFSPDGQLVLSGSNDRSLRLWEAATGTEIRTFIGHTESVTSVAFSPDGRLVLSGSEDKTLRLWEAATGTEIRTFFGHTECVTSVAFNPDGRQVLSGSEDKTLRLWDAATGTEIRKFEGHTDPVSSVAFSPGGSLILSGSWTETFVVGVKNEFDNLRLWDTGTGRVVSEFFGHTRGVLSVAFSPDGRIAVSGSADGTVRLWDPFSAKETHRFEGRTGAISAVAISADCQKILAGSDSGPVHMWSIADGRELVRFEGHSGTVGSVALSTDGNHVISGAEDGTIRLWEMPFGDSSRRLLGHTDTVCSMAFSPDGRQIVSGSDDRTVRLWDVATGKLVHKFMGHAESVGSVAFSPDGRYVLSGSWDQTLRLWDAATGTEIRTFFGHTKSVTSVAFSPDGRLVLSGSWDLTLRLWDVATGKLVHKFMGHTEFVRSVAFSPDGRQIVSGSEDKTLRLWDAVTGTAIRKCVVIENSPEPRYGRVCSVAFSPEGRRILAAVGGGVYFIDVATCEVIGTGLHIPNRYISRASFNHDGRLLLVVYASDIGSGDTGVALFSSREAELSWIGSFSDHTDWVYTAAFDPNGRNVISGGADRAVGLRAVWRVGSALNCSTRSGIALSKMAIEGLDAVPLSPRPQVVWADHEGRAHPPQLAPMPQWALHRVPELDDDTNRWLSQWNKESLRERRDLIRQRRQAWNSQFEGYRYREELDADATVLRIPVPQRPKDEFGRYVGEPEGYIDYARWWQETQAPKFYAAGTDGGESDD